MDDLMRYEMGDPAMVVEARELARLRGKKIKPVDQRTCNGCVYLIRGWEAQACRLEQEVGKGCFRKATRGGID